MRCAACGYEGCSTMTAQNTNADGTVEKPVLYVCPSCGTVRAE